MQFRLRTLLILLAIGPLLAGAWWLTCRITGKSPDKLDSAAVVHPGQRDQIVTAKGKLNYVGSRELRREVGYPDESLKIRTIVPDWSHVEAGDPIVEFDSSGLQKQRAAQAAIAETQRSLLGQAQQGSDDFVAHQSLLASAESRLTDLEIQISRCTILAPIAGQVAYANQRGPVVTGVSVRYHERIADLLPTNKVQVVALVKEDSIALVSIGMPVTIWVDGFANQVIQGQVVKVSQYAEPGGPLPGRLYRTFIDVFDPPNGLRNWMVANVQILVGRDSGDH